MKGLKLKTTTPNQQNPKTQDGKGSFGKKRPKQPGGRNTKHHSIKFHGFNMIFVESVTVNGKQYSTDVKVLNLSHLESGMFVAIKAACQMTSSYSSQGSLQSARFEKILESLKPNGGKTSSTAGSEEGPSSEDNPQPDTSDTQIEEVFEDVPDVNPTCPASTPTDSSKTVSSEGSDGVSNS
jgi:hypothetical protein